MEEQRDEQALYNERQSTFERIASDETFVRHRNAAIAHVNATRDNRELNESLVLQDIADSQNDVERLVMLDQRNEDFREHQIERDARVIERQIQEQAETNRQKVRLRQSVERILNHGTTVSGNEKTPRGSIVDVVG